MYVADYGGHAVYKIDRLANTTTIAGTPGKPGFSGDGGLATSALLNAPSSVAVDAAGNIYIAELNNARIRKIGTNGIITTFAGTGVAGFSGDGGQASAAKFNFMLKIMTDSQGNLYIDDYGNGRIREISTAGIVSTIAGTGKLGSTGDGGLAKVADISPSSLFVAGDGTIYFSEGFRTNAVAPKVRKITTDGILTTIAGTGARSDAGDGGLATAASLLSADGVAADPTGNVYVGEYNAARIRKIAVNGIITTYAGTGAGGLSGDGGPAQSAQINGPVGMTADSNGNVFFADYNNRRIRKIAPPPSPTISFNNAGIPSFLGKAGFTSNSYLEIYGTNLSATTRTWAGSDFNGPNAPTSLDGVTVTVGGKNAFVYYISPTQININSPEDTVTGPVLIQVKNNFGFSNTGSATRARVAPTLQSVPAFNVGGKSYVVAQTPDFKSFIGQPGLIQGVSFVTAKPGDTVIVFALGCGPTNPATQAGVAAATGAPLALPYQLKIGGVAANVAFGGIVAGSIGLYQFNIVVPSVPAGDQPIELIVDGVPNAQGLVMTVGS
jgi:uncharacterized protein (TIGR03437 family)